MIDRISRHVVEWERDHPGEDVWLRDHDDGVQVLLISGARSMRMAVLRDDAIESTARAGTLRAFVHGTLKRLRMLAKTGVS